MGRKKKVLNESPEKLDSGELSDEIIPVDVDVETHQPDAERKSFRDRLSEKLSDVIQEGDNLKSFDDLSPSGKWHRKQRGRQPKADNLQAEFSTLVSSVFVLVVAAWNAPGEVKPNDDEINGTSNRVTRIILRHVDLSGRITADVLDLIGIIAIGASYYSRVAPALKSLSKPKVATIDREAFFRSNGSIPGDEPYVTPIEQADPNLKSWLDNQATEEG